MGTTRNLRPDNDELIVKEAIALVCKCYSIKEADLHKKTQKWSVSLPRLIIMAIAYKITKLSPNQVASQFNRNRVMTYHAVEKVEGICLGSRKFRSFINSIYWALSTDQLIYIRPPKVYSGDNPNKPKEKKVVIKPTRKRRIYSLDNGPIVQVEKSPYKTIKKPLERFEFIYNAF